MCSTHHTVPSHRLRNKALTSGSPVHAAFHAGFKDDGHSCHPCSRPSDRPDAACLSSCRTPAHVCPVVVDGRVTPNAVLNSVLLVNRCPQCYHHCCHLVRFAVHGHDPVHGHGHGSVSLLIQRVREPFKNAMHTSRVPIHMQHSTCDKAGGIQR